MQKFKLILASQSPRRKQLLKLLGINFDVLSSDIKEISEQSEPRKIVEDLAIQKAEHITGRVSKECLCIGADTVVVYQKEILGKPKTINEAKTTLKKLSGKEHQVITGVCFSGADTSVCFSEVTTVSFSALTEKQIDDYLALETFWDKAGSYGIQDEAGVFVDRIIGCYYNVVGLPLNKIELELRKYFKNDNWKDYII